MRKKRLRYMLVVLLIISVCIFCIYRGTYREEFNYVALGDSLAAGRNPYGVDDYGYTEYVKDYLKKEGKLESYISYAVSGYTTNDVTNDISYNRIVDSNNKKVGIKKALRESDLVTVSIGANDFLQGINLSNIPNNLLDTETFKLKLERIFEDIDDLLKLIKQYAKGDVLVIGYYNPFPNLEKVLIQ